MCVVIALVICLHYSRHACLDCEIAERFRRHIGTHVELVIVYVAAPYERLLVLIAERCIEVNLVSASAETDVVVGLGDSAFHYDTVPVGRLFCPVAVGGYLLVAEAEASSVHVMHLFLIEYGHGVGGKSRFRRSGGVLQTEVSVILKVQLTSLSAFCSDEHHTVGGSHAIYGSRGVFQY